jgi:hypothetical protein
MLSLTSTTLWNAAHQLSVPKVVIREVVCAVAQDMGQRTKPLEPVHMRPGWKADPRYRNVLSPVPIGRSGICGQPMDCHITGKPETTTWLTASVYLESFQAVNDPGWESSLPTLRYYLYRGVELPGCCCPWSREAARQFLR